MPLITILYMEIWPFYSPGPQGGYIGGSRPMFPCVTLWPLITKKSKKQWKPWHLKGLTKVFKEFKGFSAYYENENLLMSADGIESRRTKQASRIVCTIGPEEGKQQSSQTNFSFTTRNSLHKKLLKCLSLQQNALIGQLLNNWIHCAHSNNVQVTLAFFLLVVSFFLYSFTMWKYKSFYRVGEIFEHLSYDIWCKANRHTRNK